MFPSLGALAQTQTDPLKAPADPQTRTLVAASAKARLRPTPPLDTEIWTFDGATPGPTLRIKQGETLNLKLENRTTAPLGLHWYGSRGDAASDGVGGFSQPPILPGETGEVRLTPPDTGTLLIGRSCSAARRSPAAAG